MSCAPSSSAKEMKEVLDEQFQILEEQIQSGVWKGNSEMVELFIKRYSFLTAMEEINGEGKSERKKLDCLIRQVFKEEEEM